MKLYLPRSATRVEDEGIQSTATLSMYHTLSEFTGNPVTVADLVRHLGMMRRSEVIRVIGNMSATVWSEHGMKLGYQMQMAQHVLPEDVWQLVRGKIPYNEKHAGRLFHRRQVWFLLQMAIMSCSETCSEMDPMELQKKVGLAALMASDVLQQVEHTHMPDLEDAPNADQWAATSMMSLMDTYVGNEMICRAICFWMEAQDDPAVRQKMNELGLPDTLDGYFLNAHGLTLRDFIMILVKAYYVFQVGAMGNPPESQVLEPSVMHEKQFTTDQIAKAFVVAGIAPDKLSPLLLGARQSWATDFSPIRSKPLIEVYPGKYTCADASIFGAFFMDGIFDLLQEAVPDDKFRQLFGTLFERYINMMFEQFLCGAPPLVRRFAADPSFVGPRNDQAGDGVILLNDMTVLMEYKGGMLTRRQKYATNIRETIAGIETLLAKFGKGKKGVGQLVENIERILKGEKLRVAAEELDIPATSTIIPVLVVYDDSLGLHAVRNHVEAKLLAEVRNRKLPEDRIGPLCILTMRDVESIQDYSSGVSVEAIFKDYCEYLVKGREDTTGSFHGFIISKYKGKQTCQCFVQAKVGQLLKGVLEQMLAARKDDEPAA